jgi:hypothetical protein
MAGMDDVRAKLPGDSLAALSALVRILSSAELSRGLFSEKPARPPRKRLKKARPRRPRVSRG